MGVAVQVVFAVAVLNLLADISSYPHHHQAVITKWNDSPNLRPIIGILSQEYRSGVNESYIAASYVKFVEAGGSRVVPFRLGRPNETYTDTLNSINGALFPGGSASITDSMYAKVGNYIFQYAKEANDRGDYFPIWATCLGFEMLASFLAPGYNVLTNCSASDLALPLNFTEGATNSRLFKDLPTDVYQALLTKNVTANYHHKCLTPETVQSTGLNQVIKVLSTNYDANGLEFVSTFEVLDYPFYAVQWHPEKAPWEWTTEEHIPHTEEAVRVTQYFAGFLASEVRKSTHSYEDSSQETEELIYNFDATYTGKTGSDFVQEYIMKVG